jgi:hypothetical protein
MQASSALSVVFVTALSVAGAEAPPTHPFDGPADVTPASKIDELVFEKLKQIEIRPANSCSDEVFVRRVYLDVIGTLPTPDEARRFLQDQAPDKRRALVDRLLEREEYADYWAVKWGDLLRVKAEFPINLWPNAAQAYHRWIRTGIKENKPYDCFVREMLTASGSNFRVPQVNFYRAIQSRQPEGIAQAVALTFMGARAEKWPKDRLSEMAVFFQQTAYKCTAEWKEEIVYFDPGKGPALPAGSSSRAAVFPDGTQASLPSDRDPREVFADWLLAPQNPWFARNIVNRAWSWLLGRGIIHEPDDLRPDNPPRNPELLAWLEQELLAARYDLKHILRLILNSKTYQLSSIPGTAHPDGEACFSHYPLRRLEAEVLIDALNQVTGTTERYSSAIPEPFTFIPEDQRATELADGSISSSFLEMFGRPSRDTGLESERSGRPSAAQRLHLLNSSHIQRKLEQGPRIQSLAQSKRNQREVVDELYLMVLSRFPTEAERKIVATYAGPGGVKRREVIVDLAWALCNCAEFLYRH